MLAPKGTTVSKGCAQINCTYTRWVTARELSAQLQRAGQKQRLTVPEGRRLPVVVVVGEAGEARQAALLPLSLAFLFLPLLLPPPVLLEELQLAIDFLGRLPMPTEGFWGHGEEVPSLRGEGLSMLMTLAQIFRYTGTAAVIDDLYFFTRS